MSGWTIVVPIKPVAARKSRLAGHLDAEARARLSESLLAHVLDVAGRARSVCAVVLLSEAPQPGHILDRGRGLNVELAALPALFPRRLAVLHADLPALSPEDVDALTAAAGAGIAIAPDRHRRGTNAIAAADAGCLRFAFGIGSFARHQALMPGCVIVDHPGLALDIDTIDDIAVAKRSGHVRRDEAGYCCERGAFHERASR